MDEATLFKFNKCVDYGKSHIMGKNSHLPKRVWSGSRDRFLDFKPTYISGRDEAKLIKFAKWIDYGKSHPRSKNFPLKGAWSGSRDPV